jgi:hypothetical protein
MERNIFNQRQRIILAEKAADLGNITVGLLVLGQLISDTPFNLGTSILGIALAAVFYFTSIAVSARL